jgi:hypothetical protein
VQDDGGTARDHLKAEWRSTGVKPVELEQPELCEYGIYLWNLFCEIDGSERRAREKLTAQDLQGWEWRTGRTLTLLERRAVSAMDRALFKQKRRKA